EARVISCAGKHIYPGFVSANSVLGLTEVSSVRGTNDYAEIGDINPNIRAEVAINPESDLLPVARVNGVTIALVIPRGGAIGEIAVMFRVSALNQIRAALNFVDEMKLTRVIFLDGYDAWRVADELKRRNIAVITGGLLGPPARRGEPYDARYTIPAKLHQAGVAFCISDGGGSF